MAGSAAGVPLPGWVMVEPSVGPRLFGFVEERMVGGVAFLDVQFPRGRSRRLVNVAVVSMVTPVSEETCMEFGGGQWGGGRG